MTDTQPSRRTKFVAASLLWGFWTLSALPLFVLLYEFRCGELGKCGAEWWYYARFYSHFFLYPVTFGLISTVLLHRPWIRSVHHLRSLPERRARKVGFIVVSMLLVVGFASYVEFTRATPALWSFAPRVSPESGGFDQEAALGKVHHSIEKRCSKKDPLAVDDPESTQATLDLPPDSPPLCGTLVGMCEGDHRLCRFIKAMCLHPSQVFDEREKCDFANLLLLLDEKGTKSKTEWAYYAGFTAMTTLFSFLFMAIFVAITSARQDKESKRTMIFLLTALFFASFWMLMRIAFLTEKLAIYPEDPLLSLNYMIFLALVALYVHIVTTLWRGSKRYEKYLNVLLSIAGVAIGVLGLFKDSLSSADGISIPAVLVRIFGTEGSHLTYIGVLLFLLIVYFPNILRLLGDDRKDGDPSRPDTA